ncbi:BRICHOS domain [Cinara cedri]|uniref:Integral membrane protein 2 n=1 Tax=Cinara cedri TaxID=506608 RepID=A0A5E4NGK5_9HEMI|nr:BRICHOS domain [Cinara cedri]
MTVVKIPSETIKECGQCAIKFAEHINQIKSRRQAIRDVIYIVFIFVAGVVGIALLSRFYCEKSTLKLNFEIKGDTQLYEYYISHVDAESEMLLSSLLDNNGKHFFELNTTIEFVDYIQDSCLMCLEPEVRVIHDFHGNLTSIINNKKRFCHIMPIIRTILTPPISISDLKIKITSHYYATEFEKSMRNTYLIKPSVNDLSAYGEYIPETCADYDTFKIMK